VNPLHLTGGAAFPLTGEVIAYQEGEPQFGMTLRDYFAAKALQGLCALDWQSAYQQHMPSAEVYAENAYCIADAMIKAREVSQ
jgi:hypothetical protein